MKKIILLLFPILGKMFLALRRFLGWEMDGKQINIVGFSGGPASGKTTSIHYCANAWSDKGYQVFIIPEAATILIKAGVVPGSIFFQCCVFILILVLETSVYLQAKKCKGKKIILCDRTLLDGGGYVTNREFIDMITLFGYTISDICKRYTGIVYLETSAKDAANSFSSKTNKARYENIPDAITTCKKTRDICSCHLNFLEVTNKSLSFSEKLFKAYQRCCEATKEPIPTVDIVPQFYAEKFSINEISGIEYEKITISTYMFPLNEGFQIPKRLRVKKFTNGEKLFFYTKEKTIDEIQVEEKITYVKFQELLQSVETTCIQKDRISFFEDGYNYEIDLYDECTFFEDKGIKAIFKKVPLEGSTFKELDKFPSSLTCEGLTKLKPIQVKDYELNIG